MFVGGWVLLKCRFPLLLLPLLLRLAAAVDHSLPGFCTEHRVGFSSEWCREVEVRVVQPGREEGGIQESDRFVGKTQESSIPISKLNCTLLWAVLHYPCNCKTVTP